uniref:Uncharacterized protein n=1 Tax=Micrurus lemniscatus lemniscatus TaxID=129467 RepID=A0A2D4IBK5_MICLE
MHPILNWKCCERPNFGVEWQHLLLFQQKGSGTSQVPPPCPVACKHFTLTLCAIFRKTEGVQGHVLENRMHSEQWQHDHLSVTPARKRPSFPSSLAGVELLHPACIFVLIRMYLFIHTIYSRGIAINFPKGPHEKLGRMLPPCPLLPSLCCCHLTTTPSATCYRRPDRRNQCPVQF